MIMRTMCVVTTCVSVAALSACQYPTRAQYDADRGWNVYGTPTPTLRGVDPEVTVESAATYAGSETLVVLSGTVSDVCQTMGCWIEVEGAANERMLVMTKDHAFFVPRNCRGRHVHAIGHVIVQEQSVELQKHLAADAHASEATINAITEPKIRAVFIADAIILPSGGLEKLVAPLQSELEIAPTPDTTMTPAVQPAAAPEPTPAVAPESTPAAAPAFVEPPTPPATPTADPIEPLPERGARL